MTSQFEPPTFNKDAYNCPHCSAFSSQLWHLIQIRDPYHMGMHHDNMNTGHVCICKRCGKIQFWLDGEIYYPVSSIAPFASEDMPENVKSDFDEARKIVNVSPRSAAALLRLALQKLMVHLGEKGKDLNTDIGNLVKNKGLSGKIQQALDSIRVIGNESVHPGEIDMRDDQETALSLFKLLNIIVDAMITQPKLIDETYGKLPPKKIDQIIQRDSMK